MQIFTKFYLLSPIEPVKYKFEIYFSAGKTRLLFLTQNRAPEGENGYKPTSCAQFRPLRPLGYPKPKRAPETESTRLESTRFEIYFSAGKKRVFSSSPKIGHKRAKMGASGRYKPTSCAQFRPLRPLGYPKPKRAPETESTREHQRQTSTREHQSTRDREHQRQTTTRDREHQRAQVGQFQVNFIIGISPKSDYLV